MTLDCEIVDAVTLDCEIVDAALNFVVSAGASMSIEEAQAL